MFKSKFLTLISLVIFFMSKSQLVYSEETPYVHLTPIANKIESYESNSKFKNWLNQGHILGFRFGTNISGMTSLGLIEQQMLNSIQYGVFFMYKLHKNIGLMIDFHYSEMGNKQMPFKLGVTVLQPDEEKNTNDDDEGEGFVAPMISSFVNTVKGKVVFSKEEWRSIKYISIPLTLVLCYKSHPDSFFNNLFIFGPRINFLLNAKKTIYHTPSIIKKTKEEIEWAWADTESCIDCYKKISIKEHIPVIDWGLTLGYMLETDIGIIFGLRYYQGMRKIYYKKDKNSFKRSRRHYGLEFYLGYNFLNAFKYF